MLNVRKVLFPTDFSDCSSRALVHAVKVAQRHRSELHVFHATVLHESGAESPAQKLPGLREIERILEELALERMGVLVRDQDLPDLVVKQVHRRGVSAAPLIVEYAREEKIDLIVMGTHGRRGVRKLLLGSVATEVMRMAPCSVLTVRGKGEEGLVPDIRRILVPVDFSEPGGEAMEVACTVASTYGADLQLLHVLPEAVNPPFYDIGGFGLPDMHPDLPKKTEAELGDLIKGTCSQAGVSADCHAVRGHPGLAITRFSRDHDSDLIVMATHGLTGIMHFLIGSTTEKVLARAECPVLVVRKSSRSLLP